MRTASFTRLMIVEMRRALHRRLVWWMVALGVALCAAAGVARIEHAVKSTDTTTRGRIRNLPFCKTLEHAMSAAPDLLASALRGHDSSIARN